MSENIVHLPLKMPPRLASQVARLCLPPNPEYAEHPAPGPAYDPGAAEWLERKRKLITQASRLDCEEWLLQLTAGVNGVTEEQYDHRKVAVWSRCQDLPAMVWCEATMHAMWDRTPFLPTPGECREVLEAYAAPMLAEIAALERIVATPAPVAKEPLPPYVPPPAPPWAVRGPGSPDGGGNALTKTSFHLWEPKSPVRSVAEQIAALKGDPPPDTAA